MADESEDLDSSDGRGLPEKGQSDEDDRPLTSEAGHLEGSELHRELFGPDRRRLLRASLAGAAVLLLVGLAGLYLATADEDEKRPTRGSAAVPADSPAALQSQVRGFADTWVAGDLAAASTYAAVCLDEVGQESTEKLLGLTIDAVVAFEGVPRERLAVRRVVTRGVAGGSGEARIDLDPEPFSDPLDAVGAFLPWELRDGSWVLATCTFGAEPPDEEVEWSRADVIRSMTTFGYDEETAICVSDALIAELGIESLDPAAVADTPEEARLEAEATCRRSPVQVGDGFGAPDAPVPMGAVARVGDWEASVVDVVPDATRLVMDEFDFNEPPRDGYQFILVRLETTYRGESDTALLLDLGFRLDAGEDKTYDEFDDSCGLFPGEIDQVAPTAPGETREGTLCWSIRSGDVENLSLVVDSLVTLEDPRVWFELAST